MVAVCEDRRRGKRPAPPQGRAWLDSVGSQRQGAKPPSRNRIFLLRNQETKNHRKDFIVSRLPYGIVFGRVFAPLRLCVKSFLPGDRLQRLAGRKDRGKRQTAMQGRAGAGCGRNSTPSRQAATGFFYYETRKSRIIENDFMVPGLPYGIVFSPVFASVREKFFAWWPSAWWLTARSGRTQGPGQKANGYARPDRGRIGQPCRNWGWRAPVVMAQRFKTKHRRGGSRQSVCFRVQFATSAKSAFSWAKLKPGANAGFIASGGRMA